MDITPEDLKRVAEYMGYKSDILDKGLPCESVYIRTKHNFPENLRYLENAYEYRVEYNPPTNPEQDRKIEIKLIHSTNKLQDEYISCAFDEGNTALGVGKTPSEARLRAVIAMIGDK